MAETPRDRHPHVVGNGKRIAGVNPGHLGHKKRVAAGSRVDLLDEACRKASTGQSGQQTRRAVQRETVQHDARHAQPCESAQHLYQRSCNFAVAIGCKDQQRSFTDFLSHELQEKQRALVGPVHVFEDEQDGSLPSRSLKDSADRIRYVEPNRFVVRDGRAVEGKSLTQLGQNETKEPSSRRTKSRGCRSTRPRRVRGEPRPMARTGGDPSRSPDRAQRTRAPRVFARAANTWASVVLPIPASPAVSTICPRPRSAPSSASHSCDNSCSRFRRRRPCSTRDDRLR